jgi:ATP-dependent helicase/nuclease subunit A
MSAPHPEGEGPDAATRAQVRASRPDRSSWVSANAGSGKTRVLTARVARLLVRGTDPRRILCLTYTKAAAAEMQNRLFALLGEWAMMPDGALAKRLVGLGETAVLSPADLARTRTLFARALETPGGLKIQTIHAFCDRLLRQFPLEAGVSPDFGVLEDRRARQVRDAALEVLARGPDAATLDAIAPHVADGDALDRLLMSISAEADAFDGDFDGAALRRELALPEAPEPDDRILASLLDGGGRGLVGRLHAAMAGGSTGDRKSADRLQVLSAGAAPGLWLDVLEKVLLTGEGAAVPFSAKVGTFATAATRAAMAPADVAAVNALATAVEAARQVRLGEAAFARAVALNRFARAWLPVHAAEKTALGALDYDDLIDRTRRLLTESDGAAWVMYRLDGGIDHILVDEAQDTSPAQWQVIGLLTDEFFAGAGAVERPRTVFAVGDEKQSIYSFQGADPAEFRKMGKRYQSALNDVADTLEDCDLLYSFRSAPVILAVVDAVCSGLAGTGADVRHRAFHAGQPGRVELWPFLETERDDSGKVPWHQPVDAPSPGDRNGELARAVAARVAGLIGTRLPGSGHEGTGRGIVPADILILLRRRRALFHRIIRELKALGVPVSGADRLTLVDELAVRDLLALLAFLSTPEDDHALACVLRSPLGGLGEGDLYGLAQGRTGTLWQALWARRDDWPDLVDRLDGLLRDGGFRRPYEVLETVLVRHRGREALLARLGAECEDAIDELLAQALDYEMVEPPGLTGFLAWIGAGDVEVKRPVEEGGLVRVMTVHGAKGLEAPVVILPETGRLQQQGGQKAVLRLESAAVWDMAADEAPAAIAGAASLIRASRRAEDDRLLYVAMTRARNLLIVCGAGSLNAEGNTWYQKIAAGMDRLGATAEGAWTVIEAGWDSPAPAGGVEGVSGSRAGVAPAPAVAAALPDWAVRRPEDPPRPPRDLRPSQLGGAHAMPGAVADAGAIRRGKLLHLLLERLPDVPPADREKAARAILRAGGTDDEGGVVAAALDLIARPGLAAIFGPGSLPEVPVSAALPELGGRRIAGTVDRLVLAPDGVRAVDFKSHTLVPALPDAVPEAILRQMGAYSAALGQVWADREVTVSILWTRTGDLMYLPRDLVMAALRRAAVDPVLADP